MPMMTMMMLLRREEKDANICWHERKITRGPGGPACALPLAQQHNQRQRQTQRRKQKQRQKQKNHPGAGWSCLLVPSSCATTNQCLWFSNTRRQLILWLWFDGNPSAGDQDWPSLDNSHFVVSLAPAWLDHPPQICFSFKTQQWLTDQSAAGSVDRPTQGKWWTHSKLKRTQGRHCRCARFQGAS